MEPQLQTQLMQDYQKALQSGATPEEAREGALAALAEQQTLMFNQGSGSRLFNAFLFVANQSWDMGKAEVTKPGT